jgi:hypothetical protein
VTNRRYLQFKRFNVARKMKTLEEIKKILSGHREELEERYKIKEIRIFGSFIWREGC